MRSSFDQFLFAETSFVYTRRLVSVEIKYLEVVFTFFEHGLISPLIIAAFVIERSLGFFARQFQMVRLLWLYVYRHCYIFLLTNWDIRNEQMILFGLIALVISDHLLDWVLFDFETWFRES